MASYTYTLDDAGYREQVVEKDGNRIEWDYDNLYRLTSEKRYGIDGSTLLQTTGFTYDLANNRQTMTVDGQLTTYHYNTLDQITYIDHPTGPNTTYTYSGRGNLAEVFDGTNSTFYGYDALDRLEEVILPTGSVYYDYDADGRRVKQTVGATVTNYLWDEFSAYGDVVMESDGSSNILASYTLAEGQLIAQTRGGNKSYYLKDGQNSTRLLTNTLGVETDRYTYTAFGEHTQTGSTINNYLYTGQQFDAVTGNYSLRARYYDPTDGRFLSRDTYTYQLQNPVELNRYIYGVNNPATYYDPTGHFVEAAWGYIKNIALTRSYTRILQGGAQGAIAAFAGGILGGAVGAILMSIVYESLGLFGGYFVDYAFNPRVLLPNVLFSFLVGAASEFITQMPIPADKIRSISQLSSMQRLKIRHMMKTKGRAVIAAAITSVLSTGVYANLLRLGNKEIDLGEISIKITDAVAAILNGIASSYAVYDALISLNNTAPTLTTVADNLGLKWDSFFSFALYGFSNSFVYWGPNVFGALTSK